MIIMSLYTLLLTVEPLPCQHNCGLRCLLVGPQQHAPASHECVGRCPRCKTTRCVVVTEGCQCLVFVLLVLFRPQTSTFADNAQLNNIRGQIALRMVKYQHSLVYPNFQRGVLIICLLSFLVCPK